MDILDPNFKVDLLNNILWQYDNATALKSLLSQKSAWVNINNNEFWKEWYQNVFNLPTANDFGLSVWGKILNFPRQITLKDGTGYNLSTEQYRLILMGQLQKFRMRGTVPEINQWLTTVFGSQGPAYVIDNYNMTTVFIFEFQPTDDQQFLLDNVDFLPRPAGVGYEIRILPNIYLGFEGSRRQTFDNGIIYDN